MVILALGKFGGREMNYHSDLDIVFLYEADGQTAFDFGQWAARSTSNQHFFSELAQRIIKTTSRLSPQGKLYEVDARLRPTGKSGAIATSLAEFSRYYAEGSGQLWERQALCKAAAGLRLAAGGAIGHGGGAPRRLRPPLAPQRRRRNPPHAAAAGGNRRGRRPEARARRHRRHRVPGPDAPAPARPKEPPAPHARTRSTPCGELHAAGLLADEDHDLFQTGYRLLRTIEGRLRLMNSTARDRLPQDPIGARTSWPTCCATADSDGPPGRVRERLAPYPRAVRRAGGARDKG